MPMVACIYLHLSLSILLLYINPLTHSDSRFVVGSPRRRNETFMLRLYHYDVIKQS
jgi:hypothetical protein